MRLQAIAPAGQAQPLIAPLAMQPELLARLAITLQRLLARPALLLQVLAQLAEISTDSRLHGRQLHVIDLITAFPDSLRLFRLKGCKAELLPLL